MKTSVILTLLLLCPFLALADVNWHPYEEHTKIKIGRVEITIETRESSETGFQGDDLILTVRGPGQPESHYWFTSSYGFGSVAIQGKILLLKYGVGRGTAVRVDHVKALRLDRGLIELADVQTSYRFEPAPKDLDSKIVEYGLKAQTDGSYTTLTISLRKPQRGLPTQKILRIKNDG